MFIHRENVRDWLIAVAIVLVGAVLLAVLQVVMARYARASDIAGTVTTGTVTTCLADGCYFDERGRLHCVSLYTPRCPDGHPAVLSFDGSVRDWDVVGHFYCSQREIVRHRNGWRYLEAEPNDPKEWSGE